MEEKMHERDKCGEQIHGRELAKFCWRCELELNEKGLCAMCGTTPNEPNTFGSLGRFCKPCQKEFLSRLADFPRTRE